MAGKKEVKVIGLYTLRTLVTLLGIWILKLIVVSLPFFKALSIPNFPFTILQIVNLLIAMLIVAIILNFGFGLSKYWPMEFPKVPEAGTVLAMIIFLIGLTSAYGSVKELLETLVEGSEAVLILQIAFLVISALLLVRAALVVYISLPKWLNSLRDSITTPPDLK